VRTKLTQAAVERVPLAPDGSAYSTDTELRGFMLIVGGTSKRYYAQTLATIARCVIVAFLLAPSIHRKPAKCELPIGPESQ
jgi:hypothetical protein